MTSNRKTRARNPLQENSNSIAGSSLQHSGFQKTGLCTSQSQFGSIGKHYLGCDHDTGHRHTFPPLQKISKTSVE